MQDPLSSTAPSFGTSSGTAIWQNEWIDALWEQLTSGTFSGIDNVVVDGDLAEGEARLQADLDALDQMLAGSAKQSVVDIQSYALSNRFNPGLDPLTGSLPVTKSLANVLQYAYQQGLPDLVAEVSGSSFPTNSAPGEVGQLSVTVRNQGGLKTQTPITLKVFASQQPVLDNQAVEIGEHSWQQLKLKPNKREQAKVSVRLPETLASGTYNIFVVVDTSSNLRESNKANNISVAAQSQIVVAASSAPPPITSTTLTASKAMTPASQPLSNSAASHDCHLPFSVVAEGRVSINGSSDFDGDPLLPDDDALIYGGRGLTLNGQPTLPVQRDASGNPVQDSQGRPLLVENAIAVSNNYSVFNAPNNQYGGLFPPPIVETQTVTVPAHNALVDATLAKQIPQGASVIAFNPRSQKLNNSQDWATNFPPGGTASNPSVVRITGGGLTIPNRVTLENTILLVDSGDINFNGSGHQLNNVTLVTYNGGINLSNVVATDLTAIASRQLNMNGGARFGGQSLLASQNSVTFNGATTSGADKLKVISQSDITFNGSSDTRAQFLAAGNFNFNGNSTLHGRIKVKGDITFNGSATVVAANDAPIVGENKTIVVAEDSGATALKIGLPVDPDDDLLSLRVSEVPDLLKGSVLLANGNAVAVGQKLSLSDLQGLSFVPTADANGAAGRFSYTADDGWCQPSSQTIELQITPVNDGPVITAPSALSLAEDTTLSFLSGLQIQDVDSGELPLQATLSVSQGKLRLGAATSGQRSLVLTGSLSELNASLAQLHYQPDADYTGADALTITVNDQGNTGAGGALSDSVTVDLTITPVNDAPVLTGPTLITLPEDASQPIVGLQVVDIDAGDLDISVRLSVGEGTLRLTQQDGITVQAGSVNGASEWIFQGTVAAINIALSSLSYQGAADYAGADTLLFEVNDLGNTGAGGPLSALHTVALEITPVNDAPVLSGPALVTVVEDSLQAIAGLQVSDVDAGSGELSVHLSVEQGTLQLSQVEGLSIQAGDVAGAGELVFQGTLSAINAALSSLSYQGAANYAGADALRFEVSDLGNTGAGGPLSQTHTVGIQVTPVNDGPIISAPTALSLPEDTPLSFLSSLQIQDVDAGELPLQVTLSVSQGNLHFSNAASAGQNTLLLTGSLSELNAQLGYLQYRPSADYVGTDALIMTVSDLGNTGAGGALTGSATVELTITPVNDAPILTTPAALPAVEAGQDLSVTGIVIADVDAANGQMVVTLSASNGLLRLDSTGVSVTGGDAAAGSASLTLSGSLTELNSALGTLTYRGDERFSGIETIAILVDDQGNTGEGGSLSDSAEILVEVTPAGLFLQEGNSFSVLAAETFTIPATPTVLQFSYAAFFDTSDTFDINDAFEVALLDAAGNSLVHTVGAGQDAFFNLTEGLPSVQAAGVSVNGETVTLDLSDIPARTEARLVFRLVNNDDDTGTTVRIQGIELLAGEDNGILSATLIPAPVVPSAKVNFSKLEDVSGWLAADYGRTSFNKRTDELTVEVAALNQSAYEVRNSLVMVVENISNPLVRVLNADGVTPDGRAYFELSHLLGDGVLAGGETSAFRPLVFRNPGGVQFDYTVSFLSVVNEAPVFVSEANQEALAGKPYRYSAKATDADGDTLSYSLVNGPEGLTVDSKTGELLWNPAATDVGTTQVTIQVEDGHGGADTQAYTLSVKAYVPNRPPMIATLPVVDANVNTLYTYSIGAVDKDQDQLTYRLVEAPAGMKIDEETGVVSWTPGFSQLGTQSILIRVEDSKGGYVEQPYEVVVRAELGNRSPLIVSTPALDFEFLRESTPQIRNFLDTFDPNLGIIKGQKFLDIDGDGIWDKTGDLENLFELAPVGPVILGRNDDGSTGSIPLGFSFDFFGNSFTDFYINNNGNITFNTPLGQFSASGFPYYLPIIAPFWADVDTRNGSSEEVHLAKGVSKRGNPFIQVDWPGVGYYPAVADKLNDFSLYIEDSPSGDIVAFVYRDMEWTTGSASGGSGGFGGISAQIGFNAGDGVNYVSLGRPNNKTDLDFFSNTSYVFRIDSEGNPDPYNEPGFDGWMIELLDAETNTVLSSQTTYSRDLNNDGEIDPLTEQGLYQFTNLSNGRYIVRESNRNGWSQTFPASSNYLVAVTNGETISDLNFGNAKSYFYPIRAIDPDGDPLRYSLIAAPEGATINENSGAINWLPSQEGVYRFSLLVEDGRGGQDVQTFELAVFDSNPNIPPEITSLPPKSARTNRSYQYQVKATDGNNDLLSYELIDGPAGMNIDVRTGLIKWDPTEGQIGEHATAIKVKDARGGEDIQVFTVNVVRELQNNPPVIISTPTVNAVVSNVYRYRSVATDIDRDILSYSLSAAPEGMTIDQSTGEILWVPSNTQVREHNVILKAEDSFGGIAIQRFSVFVQTANSSPVISSVPLLQAGVNTPYLYQVRAQDADGESISYRLDRSPTTMALDERTGLIRWEPTSAQIGTHVVIVTAIDHSGTEIAQRYELTVKAVLSEDGTLEPPQNAAPATISNPRTSVRTNTPYLYRVEAIDPNGDPLDYRIVEGPRGLTINREGLIAWMPNDEQQGNNTVHIEVSDGRGGIVEQRYEINVTNENVNSPPVITSAPTNFGATVGHTYRYDASAADPDGDVVLWQLVDAPVGMSIDAERGTLRWAPGANQLGNHTVTITAIDALGAFTGQSFELTVRGTNLAPLITSIPVTTAATDKAYQYQVRARDADGDALSYQLIQGPAGMSISEQTGVIEWQPTAAQVGTTEVIVAVNDVRGAGTTQTYRIETQALTPNAAPEIISQPQSYASAGNPYRYQVIAQDPNGDTLAYQLLQGPTGMNIDAATGELSWQPGTDVSGSYTVVVGANDGQLGGAQRFTLQVVAGNDAPVILSAPTLTAMTGETYRYDVRSQDPNGDRLSYALTTAPSGMTIDQFGRIRWTPTTAGSSDVEVLVSDSYGATTTQRYRLNATADEIAPVVNVFPSLFPADVNQPLSVYVQASDNVGVVSRTLIIDGKPVALTNGAYRFTPTVTGNFEAVATATDAAGNSTQARTVLEVRDFSNSGIAPTVALLPLAGQTLTSATDIFGSVQDDNLVAYSLSLAALGSNNFREIYRGTNTVDNGKLGILDTSLFQNDAYTLRLTAEDGNGNVVFVDETVNIGGNLKLGNFTLSFTDMELPVSGIPVTVTRTYDSLNANTTDDFGYGWRLEFRDTDLRTSLGRDEQYETFGIRSLAFDDKTKVYVTPPGGQRQGFTFAPQRQYISNFFPAIGGADPSLYKAAFKADAGVTSTLSVRDSSYLSRRADGSFIGLQGSGFNPEDSLFGGVYVLTTKEGIEYEIDAATGDLLKAKDLNGNTVTFDDSGIYSDNGSQITFGRDVQGRITSVIDPLGAQVRYEYDGNGDLVAVTDRVGSTTRLDYSDEFAHYLDEVIDPLGRSGVKSEYDEQGRLRRLLDVNGEAVELVYDPANSQQTVKDVLGNPTTYVYDPRGNVVTELDAVGKVTKRSYDASNNVLSETIVTDESGPNGWTTSYTYDGKNNQLSRTNALGDSEYYSYNNFGQLVSRTDALGNTTQYVFDSRGNVTSKTDAAGNAIKYTYSRSGNVLSIEEGANDITRYSYDIFGNRTSKTDALGNTTTYTYDKNGNQLIRTMQMTTPTGIRTLTTTSTYDSANNVTSILDAEGNLTRYEYDANNNQTAIVDALGRRTEMRYDDKNKLVETILPDDTPNDLTDNPRIKATYDAAGNRTSITDADGRTTAYTQDALNRPTGMILSDSTPGNLSGNPRITVEYDRAGRMSALVSESGARAEYNYDAVGRLLGSQVIQDTQPQTSRSTFDANGKELSRTDALGRKTEFIYDQLGQLIKTVYPDGTRTQTAYDNVGNVVATINQLGQRTAYEYDALDRLMAVIDTAGKRTSYEYDEVGNLVKQTDALGYVTRFEYDGLGRMTATVRPLGQRSKTEYDSVGRIVKTTDFNGDIITYQYNALNQLIGKHLLAEGITVGFSYSGGGKRESVTDERGTTLYDYDGHGRLLSRTEPDGHAIAYSYHISGQVKTITTPSGVTTYQYTDLNQLSKVIAPNGDTTTYTYNVVGNLVSTERPNGTSQNYEYDNLNRITYQENKNGSGSILASYRYTYDEAGSKTSVLENTGRRVQYVYDELSRLTQEIMTDPDNGDRTVSYTFDAVGNRLTKNDSVDGLTAYVYDENDRLLSETTAGVTTTYTYDDNGNLTRKASSAKQTVYTWNSDNRLIGAAITNGSSSQQIAYSYDADGTRVAKTVDGSETRYLVDANRQYAQVLEEYKTDTGIEVSYVYGNELSSQYQAEESIFYLYDGHSGVRGLTDASGSVADTYLYDAYGNVLKQVGDTENSYLYRGEQSDAETNLQYLRARYNDVNTGRFVSTDPFLGEAVVPLSRHRYLYGYNNPLTYIDPTGQTTINEILTGFSFENILNNLSIAGAVTAPVQLLSSEIGGIREHSIHWKGIQSSFDVSFGQTSRLLFSTGLGADVYVLNSVSSEDGQYREVFGLSLAIHADYGVGFNESASSTAGTFEVWTPIFFGQSVLALSGGYMAAGLSGFIGISPVGIGGGYQFLSMGYGRGNANGFGASVGLGRSAGIQLGLSIPLPIGSAVIHPTPNSSN